MAEGTASEHQPEPGNIAEQMNECRRRIDALDEEIVRLLNARAACATEVGLLKSQVGLETYQPSREVDVLEHVQSVNAGPLEAGAVRRLFERIIDESRRLERLTNSEK